MSDYRTAVEYLDERMPDEMAVNARAILGVPGALTATTLELPSGLAFDQWHRAGLVLRYLEKGVMWWIGDWWRYGQREYGEMASQAAQDHVKEITGYAYKTVSNAAWVADRIEAPRRRESLSWSHHEVIAKLDPPDQEHWLDVAEERAMPVHEFRRAVRSGAIVDVEEAVEVEEVCEHCGRRVVVKGE